MMTYRRTTTLALGAALAAMMGACSGSPAGTPLAATPSGAVTSESASAPAGVASASPTDAPSTSVSPSLASELPSTSLQPSFSIGGSPGASGSIAVPSFSLAIPTFHGAADLEAMLPEEIGGVRLNRQSMGGETIQQLSGSSGGETLTQFVQKLGKQPSDLSAAFASDAAGKLTVTALRVAGANQDQLLQEFKKTTQEQATKANSQVTLADATVGGKSVTTITRAATATTGSQYVYAKGDTLFQVATTDAALAEQALSKLP